MGDSILEVKIILGGAVATKIIVLHHYANPTWSCRELLKAALERGVSAVYERIQALDAIIDDGRLYVEVRGGRLDSDAVIVRSLGAVPSIEQLLKRVGVLEAFRLTGRLVVNKPFSMLIARDKWLSIVRLQVAGLPVPRTLVTENPYTVIRFINRYGRAVVKPVVGSLGLGSTLVTDGDVGYQVSRTLLSFKQPIYVQEFIEKPGYDYRLFVVGDHVVAAMKRVLSRGWKTNIAQGARGVPLRENEDPEAFELALKTVKILDLDYSGVDIVVDKEGKHYIIEANASPLWHGLMEATGVNPAIHIIDYIISKYKR